MTGLSHLRGILGKSLRILGLAPTMFWGGNAPKIRNFERSIQPVPYDQFGDPGPIGGRDAPGEARRGIAPSDQLGAQQHGQREGGGLVGVDAHLGPGVLAQQALRERQVAAQVPEPPRVVAVEEHARVRGSSNPCGLFSAVANEIYF